MIYLLCCLTANLNERKRMIKINGLNKKYEKTIYYNFDYIFGEGIYQILGPNGSGKSTLFEIITKKTTYEGKIEIMGENNLSTDEILSKYITYITQEDNFIESKTARENIDIFYQDFDDDALDKMIRCFDFESLLKTKVKQLSGGERKKLQIIIGLAFNRPIIILDEADNHLDDYSLNLLSIMLQNYKGTILFTSHTNFLPNATEIDITNIDTYSIIEEKNTHSKPINFSYKYDKFNQKLSKKLYFIISILLITISLGLFSWVSFYYSDTFNAFNFEDNNIFPNSNAIVVEPPVNNNLSTVFATEDWFQTTPFYLTEEFVNTIKTSEHVNNVEVLPDINISSSNIEYQNEIYSTDSSNDFSISLPNIPKDIAVNINVLGTNINNIDGEWPDDDAYEIVIPSTYSEENNLFIGDDLTVIGQNQDSETHEFSYKIVGINNSLSQSFVASYQSSASELAVDKLDDPEYLEHAKKYIKSNTIGFDPKTDIDPNAKYYQAIYVETKSKDDTIALINELQDYDPYLSITSNYMGSTSLLNQYTDLKSKDLIIKLAIYNFVIIIILMSLFRYLDYKYFKNYYLFKLTNYGYNSKLIAKIANNINKKYNSLLTIYGMIIFLLFIIFKLKLILITFIISIFYIIISAVIGKLLSKKVLNIKESHGNNNK